MALSLGGGAHAMGFLYPAVAVLAILIAACGLFLMARPSVKGVRIWTAIGAVESLVVTILLFASKMILDSGDLFTGKFLVKNFGIGYWLLLITAFVGLYFAMAATKISMGYIKLVRKPCES